jgi:hypothetical protein
LVVCLFCLFYLFGLLFVCCCYIFFWSFCSLLVVTGARGSRWQVGWQCCCVGHHLQAFVRCHAAWVKCIGRRVRSCSIVGGGDYMLQLRFWFVDDYRSDFLVARASASMTQDRAQWKIVSAF